jgi:hypothetical protein
MKKIAIIIIALGMFSTINALAAADVPMRCNLTCMTDYSTPQELAEELADDELTDDIEEPTDIPEPTETEEHDIADYI